MKVGILEEANMPTLNTQLALCEEARSGAPGLAGSTEREKNANRDMQRHAETCRDMQRPGVLLRS